MRIVLLAQWHMQFIYENWVLFIILVQNLSIKSGQHRRLTSKVIVISIISAIIKLLSILQKNDWIRNKGKVNAYKFYFKYNND